MVDIIDTRKKVRRARQTCITDEQITSYRRYYQLYRAELKRQTEDFQRTVPRDAIRATAIVFGIMVIIVSITLIIENY